MERPHKIHVVSHKHMYRCPVHYRQLSYPGPTSNIPCFGHAAKQTLFENKKMILCPYFPSKDLDYLITGAVTFAVGLCCYKKCKFFLN